MEIERLDINDFGIFTNQTMPDLSSNLVVVGGLNRAGKTTLLQVLRFLGYGFPRDGSVPPAKEKYRVQADCRLPENQKFNISLTGYGKPQINGLGAEDPANVYQTTLDEYTYQQLFTISLDELQQIPGKNNAQQRLQSILLGAGLSDILNIQQISKELSKEAEDVGGKNGNCDVYQFRGPHQLIEEGIKLKESAVQELDQYREIQAKLAAVKKQITAKKNDIEEHEAQATIFDVVKSNFEDWEQKKKLELRLADLEVKDWSGGSAGIVLEKAKNLKENYKKATKDYRTCLANFKQQVATDRIIKIKDKLLEKKTEVKEFKAELSGLKERIKQLRQRIQRNNSREKQIKEEIRQQNQAWTDFESILNINSDQIAEDRLNQTVNKYKQLIDHLTEKQDKLEELRNKKQYIEQQLEAIEDLDLIDEIHRYYRTAGICLAVGLIVFLFGFGWAAVIISLVGIIGGGINFFTTHLLENNSVTQQQNLQIDLNEINSQLAAEQTEIEQLQEQLTPLEEKLDYYRDVLRLPVEVSVGLIKDSFRQVKVLKQKIIDWQAEKRAIADQRQKVTEELGQLQNLLTSICSYLENKSVDQQAGDLIANCEQLFSLLSQIDDYLQLAVKLNSKAVYKQELATEIREFLPANWQFDTVVDGLEEFITLCRDYQTYHQLAEKKEKLKLNVLASLKTERVTEAFKRLNAVDKTADISRQQLLTAFDSFFTEYTSQEDIERRYEEESRRLEKLNKELADLQRKKQSLLDKQSELATSDKLTQARQKISQGRKQLRPLAKEFAVKRAASFILDKVRNRFLNRVQEDLLAPASEMLARMTDGEYQKIMPQEDLTTVDFNLQLATEEVNTVEELSRGTKEQLFLAVRLSRIKEIEPRLPVILDDSLVNFDDYHLQEVVKLLNELAESHQVFVLTCHANLVNHLAEQVAGEIQYWKLDRGLVELTNRSQLIDYLSVF